MPVDEQLEDPSEQAMKEQAQAELAKTFEEMPYEIPLLLFTSPLKNDPFCEAARQAIRAIREIAPKITLREYAKSLKNGRQNIPPRCFLTPNAIRCVGWELLSGRKGELLLKRSS